MRKELITMENISKHFSGVKALAEVDFSIKEGEIRCLAGENGSGKSTLVKILSGVHPPEKGARIRIAGENVHSLSPHQAIERGIAVIYQDLSLFPNLSVEENIYFSSAVGTGARMVNRRTMRTLARETMAKIGVDLDPAAEVGKLSMADQQLVAICRALTREVKLLIMDEPTTALTRVEVDALFKVVRDLQAKGVAALFISHKLDEVFEISHSVTILRDGRLVGHYGPQELDPHKLTYLMTGETIEHHHPAFHGGEDKVPRLEVSGLSRRGNYRDVSFSVRQGEILGITGLLGSGRTELALSLFGLNPPEEGKILSRGREIALRSVEEAVKERIAYVPENRLVQGLVMEQSISGNILLSILKNLKGPRGLLDLAKMEKTGREWIEKLKVKVPSAESAVSTLSGGNQQKVVLAKWLATEPDLLILDSPTVGIDVGAKNAIHRLVQDLSGQGVSSILISDEIPEVLNNSHRLLIMHKGRIVKEFISAGTSEEDVQEFVNSLR